MVRRTKGRYKARVLAFLLCLSLLAILLPTPISSSLSGLMQVLVPLQYGLSAWTGAPTESTSEDSGGRVDLQRQLARQEHQIASLQLKIDQLKRENHELAALRMRGFDSGRLIQARIVACDSLAWRDSRLIDRGTLRGVRKGNPVISNFCVDVGQEAGAEKGMMVLAGETYVGHIQQVSTHTAQLILACDPAAQQRVVRIAHKNGDGWQFVPRQAGFLLQGCGNGQMEIRDVDQRHILEAQIDLGDLVMLTGEPESLPVPMVVGRVSDIRPDDHNRVLYRILVSPEVDYSLLKRVYVVERADG